MSLNFNLASDIGSISKQKEGIDSMNLFKRSVISMIKKPAKTVILLFIVIILGTLMSGAISIRQAVDGTILTLRRRMPPLVTVEPDFDSFQRWVEEPDGMGIFLETDEIDPERATFTTDQLMVLAQLPYVNDFEITVSTWIDNVYLQPQSYFIEGVGGTGGSEYRFFARGTTTANILQFTQGVLEIMDGRLPTEAELSSDSEMIPILIPQPLALINDLQIGSSLEMFSTIPYRGSNCHSIYGFHSRCEYYEHIAYARKGVEFKVIGTFDWVNREHQSRDQGEDLRLLRELMQTVFIPTHVAEEVTTWASQELLRIALEEGWITDEAEFQSAFSPDDFPRNIFVLEDVTFIDDFRTVASDMLPDLVVVNDLSNTFSDIAPSMETLEMIANQILIFTIMATTLILSLLILLFMYDRRFELGVYLALGERKIKIIVQVATEVLIIASVGIIISLFVGNIISGQMGQEMIRTELSNLEIDPWESSLDRRNDLEHWGFGREMAIEDMIDAFDVAVTPATAFLFFGVGMGITLISTILPMIYILKLSPKALMLKAKIE